MDILTVSRCLPYPLHHGDRRLVHHLTAELRARGHRVDVLAFDTAAPSAAGAEPAPPGSGTLEVVRERSRSPLDYLRRLARPFPRCADQCWNPAMWEAVRRRFAERRYALVQFFGGVQVYEYRDAARDVPRVIVPYESYSRFLENTRLRAEGLARGVRARAALAMARHYERTIYRGFDRVVVAAESEAACLRGLEPRLPTAVIPLGVDATWLRHDRAEAETSHRLLFVGNCAYGPNVDAVRTLVTEVFPRVRAELPATRVTIVGADPVREVMALAGSGVEITGWVPDVRPHLARATCLVAPIRQGTGMRFKILEAMAVGLPVVTTPLGCEGIAAAPGEDVLLGQDAAELAAAALRLMRDAPLRRKIAGRARELVRRRYTWERVVDQYEALYADVLAAWKAGAGRQSSGRGVARV